MKLTNKLIEGVVSEVAGGDVIPLVKYLKNRKNVSEFKLAESIKKEVNETRNMLYRLYNFNLVSFNRKKDKKKGWYIYYWTFNLKRVKYLVIDLKKKRLLRLHKKIEWEKKGNFFKCPENCIRLAFDDVMNFNFKCPECGSLMYEEDNTKKIHDLEMELKQLKKELKN